MNNQKNIHLLQISDCHLSSQDNQQWFGRQPEQQLSNMINFINHNEPDDSTVIASGDLSHDGTAYSYQKIFQYFSRLQKKTYCLAGNHDDPGLMAQYLNRQQCKTTAHFIQGNWLVLMLDTQLSGEEHGYLDTLQFNKMKTLMTQHPDKYVFIAMHHPPVHINSAWIDKINLLNADDFLSLIAQHKNIKAVTFGHVHQQYQTTINNINFFACPSSCHQYLPQSPTFAVDDIEAGYRWFDLKQNGDVISGIKRLKDTSDVA